MFFIAVSTPPVLASPAAVTSHGSATMMRHTPEVTFRNVALSGTLWDSITLKRDRFGDVQQVKLRTRRETYESVRAALMHAPADYGLSQLVPASSLFYATDIRVCEGEDGVTVVINRPSRAV